MTEKPRSIPTTRIGGHAHHYLTARSRRGRVVSTFSGGINLLFEGGEAFVPVQSTTVPLHPWAVEIPGEPLRFPEGTPVIAEEEGLALGDVRIALSTPEVEELSLPRFSAHAALIAQRNSPILARFVEKARKMHQLDPFQEEIDTIIARWHDTGDPGTLLDLIGLGAGSTPSGDDVLVGILAWMFLFESVDYRGKEALAELRAGIRKAARTRTPLPSAQMLLAAYDRSFPEPLLTLLRSLISAGISEDKIVERAERVAQLGHHSGLAIVSGLANSIYSIEAQNPL